MSDTAPGLAEQFDDLAQQQRADLMGMWLFLATELLLFGGLFAGFAILRALHSEAFAEAAAHLDLVLGSVNTVLLLTSGLTMALAEQAVGEGRARATRWLLIATLALGTLFLAIKGYEYHHEYSEQLVPLAGLAFDFPGAHAGGAEMFFNFYFAMTGLHALHMAIGLAIIAVMLVLGRRPPEPGRYRRQLQMTGLYWAFVDVVWVFVFTSLYLLRP